MKNQPPARGVPAPARSYRIMQAIMWPLLSLMGVSCRHFAALATLRIDRPLTAGERLRFHFHRSMCALCRPLPAQFEAISKLARCSCCDDSDQSAETAPELDPEAAGRIREALNRASNPEAPRE